MIEKQLNNINKSMDDCSKKIKSFLITLAISLLSVLIIINYISYKVGGQRIFGINFGKKIENTLEIEKVDKVDKDKNKVEFKYKNIIDLINKNTVCKFENYNNLTVSDLNNNLNNFIIIYNLCDKLKDNNLTKIQQEKYIDKIREGLKGIIGIIYLKRMSDFSDKSIRNMSGFTDNDIIKSYKVYNKILDLDNLKLYINGKQIQYMNYNKGQKEEVKLGTGSSK